MVYLKRAQKKLLFNSSEPVKSEGEQVVLTGREDRGRTGPVTPFPRIGVCYGSTVSSGVWRLRFPDETVGAKD